MKFETILGRMGRTPGCPLRSPTDQTLVIQLSFPDLCASNPCFHQGTCTVTEDGFDTNCTCVEGFSGGFCEIIYNSMSVCLSVFVTVSALKVSAYLPVSVCVSVCLSLPVWVSVSACPSLSVSVSVCACLSLPVWESVCAWLSLPF